MEAMRSFLITIALVGFGCSDDKKPAADAAPQIDAPATPDAPTVKLDCATYCSEIQTNCTGANAQYGGATPADATAHCMATCAKFTPGALADQAGNTLGCRIYHAGAPAMATPATHCVHAGPAGNQVDAASGLCGDACTSFCSLEISVCGSLDTPINGIPAQYQNMGACMTSCAGFAKTATSRYTINGSLSPTTNPTGDSLACRLYHTTNAAISTANAVTHCPHTGVAGGAGATTCMAGTTPASP
jgi:hypothetical protein